MLTLNIKNIKKGYEDKKEFQNIAKAIRKSKKCIIVTGAGISVSGGIPDFRSSDGLYNLVKNKFPQAVVKGKDLFDATLFRDPVTTKVFYTFMGELKEVLNKANITPTHRFVKELDNQGKLLRCYTQNIDSLERRLQLSTDITDKKNAKIVQLHGDMDRVVCTLCQETFEFKDEYQAIFKEGNSIPCPSCQSKSNIREMTGKRAISVGSLRPNIVLYNEHHINGDLINDFANYDVSKKPDLLIVIGTSLKVYGIKNLVKRLANVVHARKTGKVIFINKTELCSKTWGDVFDYEVISTSDEAIKLLKKEINYLDAQDAIKKEMAIRKEELKEELKAKGIKYNPRIHKFNEITPDQTILKIEDKTGNLVIHIPHKSNKMDSEDENSSDDKMAIASSPIISSSPTLSVTSIFSTTSTLSSLSDLTEFDDNNDENQIILDDIKDDENLKEILAKGGETIENGHSSDSYLSPIDINEERLAMEKLSMNEYSSETEYIININDDSQNHDTQDIKNFQESPTVPMKIENQHTEKTSTKKAKELNNNNNNNNNKMKIRIVNNKLKLNITKPKNESNKNNKNVIKSIKLKLSPSKEEKENKLNYIEFENQNNQETSKFSDFIPISYRLRSRTNSMESLHEVIKAKSNIKKVTIKKSSTTTKKSTKKSTKKTSRTTKTKSTSDNLRNILKVGKRNVTPISIIPKKNNNNNNKVKREHMERNVLDEKPVNLHIGKKLRIK